MSSYLLKRSQTSRPLLFLMVDSADHITGKTGLAPTVTISKNGASFASPAGAVSEVGSGWYQVAGNATDEGTLGPLLLHATSAGADPCDVAFEVVAFDPEVATNLGLSALPTASPAANGGLPTVNAGNAVLVQSGTGAGQINLSSGQVSVAANNDKTGYALSAPGIQAIWDAATSALTTVGSIGKWILDKLNATVGSRAAPGDQVDLVNAPNAMALTAIANKVEAEIIDETDSEKVLTAITDKIASVNPSLGDLTLAAIASAAATAILATPSQKLATNPDGSVNSTIDTEAIAAAVVEALTASGVTVDSDSIADIVTALAAALATSKTIFLRSPAATTSQINLTVGDSYLAADGRALEWTINDGTLPDLTAATVGLYVDNAGEMELLKDGSVVTPTGDSRVLRVELDPTDFEDLAVGARITAAVKVTLSGRVMTLVNAILLVSE